MFNEIEMKNQDPGCSSCFNVNSSKELLFATDGNKYRNPNLLKIQRISVFGVLKTYA